MLNKVGVFFLSIFLSAPGNWVSVDRNKLTYEILNVDIVDKNLIVEGWGLIQKSQHFYNDSTHEFYLELKSDSHIIEIKGVLTPISLTKQMEYRGFPKCSANQNNRTDCNYDFENVGFKFTIPLEKLKENHDYKLFLKCNAKKAKLKHRVSAFYIQNEELIKTYDRLQYIILSHFSHTNFTITASTLVARLGPSPHHDGLSVGTYCSDIYKNDCFFRENSVFNNILGLEMYNNLITYFKVRVTLDGCLNLRRRVIESTNDKHIVYVPSTHVSYIGNPTRLQVRRLTSIPELFIEDIELIELEEYNPFKYATAIDYYDGNITEKIEIISSNVNTRIPGHYLTCYKVTNSSNKSATGCGNVVIREIPRKKRFVSIYSIHNTLLNIWDRTVLKAKLSDDDSLLETHIDFRNK